MTDPFPSWQTRINSAGRTFCTPDWHWDSQSKSWQDYDLWMVIRGHGEMATPSGPVSLSPGSCFLLRGGDAYIGTTSRETPLGVAHIHFDFLLADGALAPRDEVVALFPLYRQVDDVGFLDGIARRIVALRIQGDAGALAEAEHWLGAALRDLRRLDRQPRLSGLELEQAGKVEAICQRLSDDPGAAWRVEDLAAECHYTADHFARVFKAQKGMSPREFLQRARMSRARFLLRFSSHSVGEIAELLGYGDLQHFSRNFRQRQGISPRAYRSA